MGSGGFRSRNDVEWKACGISRIYMMSRNMGMAARAQTHEHDSISYTTGSNARGVRYQ